MYLELKVEQKKVNSFLIKTQTEETLAQYRDGQKCYPTELPSLASSVLWLVGVFFRTLVINGEERNVGQSLSLS